MGSIPGRSMITSVFQTMNYAAELIPDYGDLMSLEDFIDGVRSGMLTDDDGSGNYATSTHMSDREVVCAGFHIAQTKRFYPELTHVVWFNK